MCVPVLSSICNKIQNLLYACFVQSCHLFPVQSEGYIQTSFILLQMILCKFSILIWKYLQTFSSSLFLEYQGDFWMSICYNISVILLIFFNGSLQRRWKLSMIALYIICTKPLISIVFPETIDGIYFQIYTIFIFIYIHGNLSTFHNARWCALWSFFYHLWCWSSAITQSLSVDTKQGSNLIWNTPDSKIHETNMGPTWILLAPGGPHVGPMNLSIWDCVALGTSVALHELMFEKITQANNSLHRCSCS